MSGVDFAAFPPEVNSGLMYAGSGSGPMVSAATAWDRLAAELGSAATLYQEVISELTDGGWQGPSAEAMAAAAAPYVEWMNVTAAQAAQTASQVRSAAAAYEVAFTATVPPPVIAANRALLSSLVSTNAFGQNNPAIAANQAQYAEMWAQDATAMYSYAGNAAAATQLTPFTAAPQNTNPAGAGAATAAVAQTAGVSATSVPNALQAMTVGGWQDPLAYLEAFTTSPLIGTLDHFAETIGLQLFALSGITFGQAGIVFYEFALMQGGGRAAGGYWGAAQAAASAGLMSDVSGLESGALESTLASSYGSRFGAGGAGVSASLGRAAEVGALSVPQSWASASEIRLAAKALPTAGLAGLPQVGPAAPGLAGMGGLGGAPIMGSVVDASRNGGSGSPYGIRSKLISALPGKPGSAGQSGDPAIRPVARTVGGGRPLSEHDELQELRRIAVDLARECEVLDRSATMLLEQVPAVGASE